VQYQSTSSWLTGQRPTKSGENMTTYKDHTFKKADINLWQIATRELGNGLLWKTIQYKNSSGNWVQVDQAKSITMHDGDLLRIPTKDSINVSPPAGSSDFEDELTITASLGLNIRVEPKAGTTILSNDSINKSGTPYKYKKSTITAVDGDRRVWVEVLLRTPVKINSKTHTTGWLSVSGPSDLKHPKTSPIESWVTFKESPPTPVQVSPVPATSDPVLTALNTEYALGHLTRDQWLQKKKDLGYP
jgi:hypothetical protein